MNGTLFIHIQQNGQKWISVSLIVLTVSSFLYGCTDGWISGEGRGDWSIELINGYEIDRINSNEKILGRKLNPGDSEGRIVLSNYYIIGYQLQDPYIILEGIPTAGLVVSDEELKASVLFYYLIDTSSDSINGPYASYDELKNNLPPTVDFCLEWNRLKP